MLSLFYKVCLISCCPLSQLMGILSYFILMLLFDIRCLEEGAEDFIVKPVKLSDVKRLKNYMFGEGRTKSQDKGFNKRKLQETSPSTSPSLSPTSSISPEQSSDLSSTSSPSTPRSPPSLDSPTRRYKTSNHDLNE